MNTMRVGNLVIRTNEKITKIHTNIFTKAGYQKANQFLENVSRDFRDFFPILCKLYEDDPIVFYDSSFRKILKNCGSFHKLALAVYVQKKIGVKIPFDQFYPELIDSCYINYQEKRETGARQYLSGVFHELVAIYPNYRNKVPEFINSIDITENINSDRVIYLDNHIALTYNQDIKGEDLGELLFASRNSSGLWSFDKTDTPVPVKSLRRAKKALTDYQGKSRKGQLVGNGAERFTEFLGLKIINNYAYMSNYKETKSYRGAGFK